MEFLRKNPALAVGIGLPCAVVVLFFLATLVPSWLVAPPRYDALFTVSSACCAPHAPGDSEIKFSVSGGHLKAYRRKWPKTGYETSDLQLFLFDAKTLRLREISIAPSATPAGDDWQEFPVPETQSLTLDPSTTALDGYQFHERSDYDGDVWPFFGGGGYGHESISLGKNGREIKMALPNSGSFNANMNLHFLGWVTARDGK